MGSSGDVGLARSQATRDDLKLDGLNPVAWFDGAGQLKATFVYASLPHVPDLMITPTATYRLVTDHLGSVTDVVNVATGAVVQRMRYDTFGVVLSDSQPGLQPFGFAGGLYDDATGLVRFGARDYDAEVGRWISKDPVRFDGGTNLFAYAGGDPVNFVDTNGLEVEILVFPPSNVSMSSWLGHVAVRIEETVWSFEPNTNMLNYDRNSYMSTPTNKSRAAHGLVLDLTAEQEADLESHFESMKKNNVQYTGVTNCIHPVEDWLIREGLISAYNWSIVPSGLMAAVSPVVKKRYVYNKSLLHVTTVTMPKYPYYWPGKYH